MFKSSPLPDAFASHRFILIGIGIGILYWFIESSIHVIIFRDGPLMAQLMTPDPHEIWKRLLVSGLVVLFSLYAQHSINVRRKTEAALQEREQELFLILENNPAGIMLVDKADRKISWANSNALKMIGSRREEVENHHCQRHLCPGQSECCPVLDLGQEHDLSERILLTGKGAQLPILKSVSCVKYNGRDHLLEAFFDLSDRKAMEQALQAAHAELNQIFHTASVGMRVIDKDFNVLKINHTFEVLTGVAEAEAIGSKCYEVFAGPMCFTANCPIERILSGKAAVECCVTKRRTDGREIPCILTATPFVRPEGEFVGIVESFRDITDLKRAQEAIRSERDKLQRILSNLDEGVSIVNADFRIEYQNDILRETLGDCLGAFCYALFREREQPCERCLMDEALKTGKMHQIEYEASSGRSFELAYTPVRDVDKQGKVVVMLRDVTEKKASIAAMMRAEQLAALGELAAGVAHEINNPINGIINYAQVLYNQSKAGDMISDIAQRVIREGDRIARIVENLLSFARRRNEDKTTVFVKDLLSNALALTEAQMRKDNIELKLRIAEDLMPVRAQPQEIEQVFVNIISNARDALNQKYLGFHEDKVLEISAEAVNAGSDSFIRISFHDRGPGIPGDIIDKVKNPFFTTKTEGKRTGLGLSISHGIVEAHGGRLSILSAEGNYTRVNVDLPAWQETLSEERCHASQNTSRR